MRELFHRYFHEPEKRGMYVRSNHGFRQDTYYSYYTPVGLKVTGRDKQPVLLLAADTMSPTTEHHIRQLRAACPYDRDRIIYVPFRTGTEYVTVDMIHDNFVSYFKRFSDRLTLAENRRKIIYMVTAAREFNNLVKKIGVRVMRRAESLRAKALAIEEKKAAAKVERQRAAVEKYRVECAAILAAMPDMPYMDKVRSIFEKGSVLTTEQKRALLTTISAPGYSFVWSCGDQVRTSQGVTLPTALVTGLIRRWKAGNLPVGSHIGPYTLRAYDDQHVRIGCHNIPLENVTALAAELLPAE